MERRSCANFRPDPGIAIVRVSRKNDICTGSRFLSFSPHDVFACLFRVLKYATDQLILARNFSNLPWRAWSF